MSHEMNKIDERSALMIQAALVATIRDSKGPEDLVCRFAASVASAILAVEAAADPSGDISLFELVVDRLSALLEPDGRQVIASAIARTQAQKALQRAAQA